MSDEEQSPQDRAEAALFVAIEHAAKNTSTAEILLTLAKAYDTLVGQDSPATEDRYIATESATMMESRFWDEDGVRSGGSRGPIGFTPREG